MFPKRHLIIALLVLSVLLLVTLDSVSRSQDNLPTFYFYSTENREFMLGRAQINRYEPLYPYEIQHDFIFGPGWSPSGEWLVWTDDLVGAGSGRADFGIYLTHRNGTTTTLLDNTYQILTMSWTSSEDILYLTKRDVNAVSNLEDTEIIIYDATHSQIIANYHVSEFPESDLQNTSFVSLFWLPDSEKFVALYQVQNGEEIYGLVFINMDGEMSSHQITNLSNYCDFRLSSHVGGNILLYPNAEATQFVIEQYLEDNQLYTEPMLNNETIYGVQYVDNPQGFLVFSSLSCKDDIGKLWHISSSDGSIKLLSDSVPLPIKSSWQHSPYREINTLIELRDSKIVIPTSASLYIFDLSSSTLVDFRDLIGDLDYFLGNYVWTLDGTELLFAWQDGKTNIKSIYEYNFELDTLDKLVEADMENGAFSLSPNEQYIVIDNSDSLCCQLLIFDRYTNKISTIDFENYDYRPQSSFSEFLWHPSSEWVIVLGQLIGDYRYLYLVDINAKSLRELEPCIREESCFGWMPNLANE